MIKYLDFVSTSDKIYERFSLKPNKNMILSLDKLLSDINKSYTENNGKYLKIAKLCSSIERFFKYLFKEYKLNKNINYIEKLKKQKYPENIKYDIDKLIKSLIIYRKSHKTNDGFDDIAKIFNILKKGYTDKINNKPIIAKMYIDDLTTFIYLKVNNFVLYSEDKHKLWHKNKSNKFRSKGYFYDNIKKDKRNVLIYETVGTDRYYKRMISHKQFLRLISKIEKEREKFNRSMYVNITGDFHWKLSRKYKDTPDQYKD